MAHAPSPTLRSRFRFFAKIPRVTPVACCSGPSTSGYEAAAEFQSEVDAEIVVVLAKAPCPERSRLEDWFWGADAVPFFLEVHDELKIMEDSFLAQDTVHQFLCLHLPQWGSREGVYGGPPGGEDNCGASLARYLDAWLSLFGRS